MSTLNPPKNGTYLVSALEMYMRKGNLLYTIEASGINSSEL